MKPPTLLPALAALLVMHAAGAAEPAAKPGSSDPDLPTPFDPNATASLLENSPFTRSLNLSDSLVLTGIAYIDGKPVATVVNKATKENFVVSEEPNAQGWKLAETSATTKLNHTQAKIMIGAEVVTVRYSADALSPEALKKGGFKPGGGGPPGPPSADSGPRRDFPRPTQEQIDHFRSLPDAVKEKFRQALADSREKMLNATPEERMEYAKRTLEGIEKDAKREAKAEAKKNKSK